MARRLLALPAGLLLIFVLVSCTGSSEESAASAEESVAGSDAASAAASEGPSVDASAAASEGASGTTGELCAVGFETCTLESGTYSSSPFEPEFTFSLDDGWTNERAWPDGGGISKDGGAFYWASGTARGTVANEEVEIAGGVDGFVAFLRALAATGMTVSEATAVDVGGAAGQQVDVESNDVDAQGLFFLAEDRFNLVAGEKARFIVLDVGGETVVLIVDAFEAADFDEVAATIQPIVDSVAWAD